MLFTTCEWLVILSSILTIILVKRITGKPTPAIFNVYQQPGNLYWTKLIFMYIVLSLRKIRPQKIDYDQLEKSQKLSVSDKPIDAVYFNSVNSKGECLVTGMARRRKPLIDGFIFLKLADIGMLRTPKLPKTSLKQDENVDGYEAERIKLEPLIPMKKWGIKYDGVMIDEEGKQNLVKLDAVWSSELPSFNFDTDIDPLLMAKAMARESWSRDYFKVLKFIHQTHYEQPGSVEGVVNINGKSYNLSLSSTRDHSVGYQREWRMFHRYALHFVTVENGDRFNVAMISMPIGLSCLKLGYLYSASDERMYAVQACDLELYQHGEEGTPPQHYAFSFKAGNKEYVMEVEVLDSPEFFLSEDCESRVVERICRFKVNGLKGWGAAEWQYNNVNGMC